MESKYEFKSIENDNDLKSNSTHIEKLKTGIKGLDLLFEGGIPIGRTLTVSGYTGTGKTVLLNEFIYRGITRFGDNGVYVTCEEKPADIIENVKNFGWDLHQYIDQGNLVFIDLSPEPGQPLIEADDHYDLNPLVERIKNAIEKVDASRVAIDCLDSILLKMKNKTAIRNAFYEISYQLKQKNVTSMITSELNNNNGNILSRFGLQEYVSDGVLELDMIEGEQRLMRQMYIRKLRGVGYRSAIVTFDITSDGLEVYPKIPIDFSVAKTDYNKRFEFGIEKLDEYTYGGIPEGHNILVSGNTGTGKTLLGLQYLLHGFNQGENGVYVSLEESVSQIIKTAEEHGMDFQTYFQNNQLCYVDVDSLIDVIPDKILYKIISAVEEIDAKRVIIDSISSLESASMSKEQVRQFVIQLGSFFKTRGITCLMNYLSPTINFESNNSSNMDGILETNAMRMSSVTDGVLLMRYAEKDNEIKRYMNILKLRGSNHHKKIFEYNIEKGGLFIP